MIAAKIHNFSPSYRCSKPADSRCNIVKQLSVFCDFSDKKNDSLAVSSSYQWYLIVLLLIITFSATESWTKSRISTPKISRWFSCVSLLFSIHSKVPYWIFGCGMVPSPSPYPRSLDCVGPAEALFGGQNHGSYGAFWARHFSRWRFAKKKIMDLFKGWKLELERPGWCFSWGWEST